MLNKFSTLISVKLRRAFGQGGRVEKPRVFFTRRQSSRNNNSSLNFYQKIFTRYVDGCTKIKYLKTLETSTQFQVSLIQKMKTFWKRVIIKVNQERNKVVSAMFG